MRVEGAGRGLVTASDMPSFPVARPQATGTGFRFGKDRAAAQAVRARFRPRAAAGGAPIAATHMPFPGPGRIASEGGRWRRTPAEWAFQG